MKYTHCVQAKMSGYGWVDCRYCESQAEAELEAAELILNRNAWMGKPTLAERGKMTRIWPIEAANCYLRLQQDGKV